MTVVTEPVATPPKQSKGGELKADRMPFGRWARLVGWRHAIAVVMVIWALFPVFYVISLSFSGGQTLTSACSAGPQGCARLSPAWCRTSSTSATTRPC